MAVCEDCEGEVRYENGTPKHLDESGAVIDVGHVPSKVVYRRKLL